MNSQQNVDANLALAATAIEQAKLNNASLVVLPENFASMGRQRQTAKRFDEIANHLANLANSHQLYLLAGTLPCPYRPNGTKVADNKLRQTSLLFSPNGTQLARYDKIHLFKAMVNDNHGSYDEGLTFEAGTQSVVTPIELQQKVCHLGMMVCFDLRFPALAQHYRQAGANILTVPAAFTYQTGKAHWQMLLQARALDSQCMVVGATQGGNHVYADGSTRETWGHSTIVNANGQVLSIHNNCNVEPDKGYQLIFAPFDSAYQNNVREKLPIFNCHRLA
ncbi:MAG: carbon-nitrogen hydrolase [Gammaproteobacteria bacterium]|nr:MAG: carbon-nitrogen hydrolase [Gammaproteobacteria bacterium]